MKKQKVLKNIRSLKKRKNKINKILIQKLINKQKKKFKKVFPKVVIIKKMKYYIQNYKNNIKEVKLVKEKAKEYKINSKKNRFNKLKIN